MKKINDPNKGKAREVKIKGARGISLRACVAKAAGWTLEKANAPLVHETSIKYHNLEPWDVH